MIILVLSNRRHYRRAVVRRFPWKRVTSFSAGENQRDGFESLVVIKRPNERMGNHFEPEAGNLCFRKPFMPVTLCRLSFEST